MKSYFARHTDELDIDEATRRLIWEERIFAIHFPEDRNGVIGDFDNESIDPLDYPAGIIQNYFRIVNEISREGGYVLAEHHGHTDYLAGRVDRGTPIELIRGTWGTLNPRRTGTPAVLRGFHLQDVKVVSRSEIAALLADRPPRGTIHRWHKAGDRLAHLVDGETAETDVINQHERAFRIWAELVTFAKAKRPVTYGMLATLTDVHQRALRYPLALLETYCVDNGLPPLSILVVAKDSGRPRDGFAAWDLDDFDTGVEQVYAFDWTTYRNPFGFAANGTRVEDLVAKLVADPSAASDVYALTKVRGTVQMLFRNALLRTYGGACAISGSTLSPGLEAAHILPWSAASVHERLSIRNGIVVTAWHHRLLDGGLISLDEDCYIRVQPRAWERASEYDRARLEESDGQLLHLPADPRHHPDPALIRRRNDLLKNSAGVTQARRAAS